MRYGTITARNRHDKKHDTYSMVFTSQDVFDEAIGYILSNPKDFELIDSFFGYGSVKSLAEVKDIIGHTER